MVHGGPLHAVLILAALFERDASEALQPRAAGRFGMSSYSH